MRPNKSPWLKQLDQKREVKTIQRDIDTDIVIVGGGIAGVSTAFFTLLRTNKKVVLLEGYKIAHGATGHNAGQVTSYFEKSFAYLVEKFGLEMASEGQKAVEDAWVLLDEMYTTSGADIGLARFVGHAGLSSYEQIISHLEDNRLRVEGGLSREIIRVAEDAPCLDDIPHKYKDFFIVVPRYEILELLETEDDTFISCLSFQKGCVNSALLVQEVVKYLLKNYKDRFSLYEHTLVNKIVLKDSGALMDVGSYTISCKKVVLCTNGFDKFTIMAPSGLDVNTSFHHNINGTIGYMSGYLEKMNKPPVAISYFTDPDAGSNDPYFYLTRRIFSDGDKSKSKYNLISIGGPETVITDRLKYEKDMLYPEAVVENIDKFVKRVYDKDPNKKIDYKFTWHGLMGYTSNGIRMIGPDPEYGDLLYNLGCNGVGILPSLHGASKIADFIANREVKKSIFDIPKRK